MLVSVKSSGSKMFMFDYMVVIHFDFGLFGIQIIHHDSNDKSSRIAVFWLSGDFKVLIEKLRCYQLIPNIN